MYINENIYLPAAMTRKLQDFEQESGRPLRLVWGRGRTYAEGPRWTDTQRRACLFTDEEGNSRVPTAEEARENGLTIVMWGTANEAHRDNPRMNQLLPDDMWQERYRGDNGAARWYAYDALTPEQPLAQGEPFTLGELPLGELHERALYLYYNWTDYLGYMRDQEAACQTLFIDPLMMTLSPEAAAEWTERRRERNRKAFFEILKNGSNEGLVELEKEIERHIREAHDARAQFNTAEHQLRAKQRQLDALRTLMNEDDTQEAREAAYAAIMEHPKIESLDIVGDKIILTTTDLNITHPVTGQVAPLGKFRWSINPKAFSCEVRNLTNAKGGYDHPHVANGRPCFGEMHDAIFNLINAGHMDEAVGMIFLFLESVNLHDDWSRRAQFWFDEQVQERDAADPERVVEVVA